jgi:hypothetical protein
MAGSEVVNILVDDYGPRAEWIFRLIFEEILGMKAVVNPTGGTAGKIALNYSLSDIAGMPAIRPAGLLAERGIKRQHISVDDHDGMPVFYRVEGGDLPFDPFSMAFYLVSRYEEHLPFEPDRHGRFPHTAALAWKEGFLGMPLVNRLAMTIRDLLLKYYPGLPSPPGKYSFVPTVDVDLAYAHLGKGFLRTCGAMAKLLLKVKAGEIHNRLRSMLGKQKDPYDNFEWMNRVFEGFGLQAVYFVLVGDRSPYDRNLSVRNKRFAELIKVLDQHGSIGIHPSYRSADEPVRIAKELDRLQKVCGRKINKSRQHFVRLALPDTYRELLKYGITDDYSMGYPSICGFRASIATSFSFYDLMDEQLTGLRVHPFMFMDTSLGDYMELQPAQYATALKPVIGEVKKYNGTLCGIWHNYALGDDEQKQRAFEEIIELATDS